MKKLMKNTFALLLIILLLPLVATGYTIVVSQTVVEENVVFDASVGLRSCRYHLKNKHCPDSSWKYNVNTHTGLVRVARSRTKTNSGSAGDTCILTVLAKGCDHLGKLEFSLFINAISHPELYSVSSEMRESSIASFLNVTAHLPFSTLFSEYSWVDLLPPGGLENILPVSLRNCESSTVLNHKHSKLQYRLKDGSVFALVDSASNQMSHVVRLVQFIQNCPIVGDQNIAIPDQENVVQIRVHMDTNPDKTGTLEPHIKEYLLSASAPASAQTRRKRGIRNSISFSPRIRTVDISENLGSRMEVVTLTLNNPNNVPVTFLWHPTLDKRSLEAFTLNPQTGVVTTERELDRENMPLHSFRVTARGPRGQTADCTLLINVIDMNDNTPKFERTEYRFHLSEDEPAKTYIGRVTASDDDAGINQKIHYLIEGLQPRGVFIVNNDGEITLNARLDREEKPEYSFNIVAMDSGTSPKSSSAKVSITIDDVNDITPTFAKPQYSVRIGEDTGRGTKIATVKATDSDAGVNGQVRYSLVMSQDRNYFSINPRTGDITVISSISFADHPRGFKVRVRAQDGGRPPLSNYCDVVVNIVDINDNTPQFVTSQYSHVVSEDVKPPYDVLWVEASDLDDGDNARITYSFDTPPAKLPFRIDDTSGKIILVKPLDFETERGYVLTVRATDHGLPPKFSTAKVEIKVRDVNDNSPTFTRRLYRVNVPETLKVGDEVTRVIAKDADEDSTLLYSITIGNQFNKFRITTRDNKGVITLIQKLNFSERKSYVITVMCSDGAKSSEAEVRINVTDANTHTPEFEKSTYEISVAENVAIGTSILRVHASDKDVGENARITYELQSSSSEFLLDSKTGDIRTKVNLDYDTMGHLSLTVIAKDNGIPARQTEALVTVYLKDVNDNAPVFNQPKYSAFVLENVKVGQMVLRIEATDKDSDKNGQIVYTFEDGDDGNGYFTVDQSSGVIRTAAALDREHIAEYLLEAYAKDRGNPSQKTPVTILVTVDDVDDNAPQFPSDEITFKVPENSPVGSVVAKLHAVDPDADGKSKVSYDLVGGSAMDLWELDYETGELRPMIELDYETRANYTLTVSAYSGLLVGQVKVNINLIDVNDNPPVLDHFQIIFNNYRTPKPYTFPFGPIGKVPAHDPDVTSLLRYRFTAGNNNNLLILNGTTGELRLSSKLDNDREFTATFEVEVSDGKYNVTGDCILKVVPITDDMLTNSITVRVENRSQEDFLSNALGQFTDGLRQILNVSTQDVYIFNVKNDVDVSPHAVVNVSFSAKHFDGNYFTTQHLQEQVYLNRSLLADYSMQDVMPFDDNICLREPCENYMRCVSALYFDSTAPFISTDTVLFRPIHPVSGLRCKCPDGFAGQGCEDEINLCHPARCKNGGQCVSVEGGYVCQCNGTFSGQHCEVNSVGSRCSEAQDICKNGAECQQYPAGGFHCDCKPVDFAWQEMTQFCELRGRSFRKGDFIMFSGITRQWRFTLTLSFATLEKSGILLYNGRFNHEHDYLALELVEGQVQLNFSTGQDFTVVDPVIPGGLNDGKWHVIEVEYRNKPKREVLGKGHTGPSNTKVVTVTVDPETCDPAVSQGWHTCTRTAEQGGTKSSLDLTTPLLIGGVPDLPEAYQVQSRHFVGCIRDLKIDHRLVDMSTYVANHGSQPGCEALRDHCTTKPCSRGTCGNVWGTYKCRCEGEYGGRRCERILPVHRFQGQGCLKHRQISQLPKPLLLPWKHSVEMRTTKETGTILHFEVGSAAEVELSLLGGTIAYSVRFGSKSYRDHVEVQVNDGDWHVVEVEWKQIRKRIVIEISVDGGFAQGTLTIPNMPSALSTTNTFSELHVGGRSAAGDRIVNVFNGCIRGLEFTAQSTAKIVPDTSLTPTRGARVSSGCRIPNPCSAAPCPSHSTCIQKFDERVCQCHRGYIGDKCQGVCTLNPCQNDGTCQMRSSEPYGYRCQCRSSTHYGRLCEFEHIRPCPSGWWGNKACVPCNCPVEKNFDLDCSDSGGKCKCKDHHYYSSARDMCLPCNCYHVGAVSLDCEDESGQCHCRPTVVGKKCDQCSSNFAEVQDKGCTVQYEMCPRTFVDGVRWRGTNFGETTLALCPKNTVGHVTRVCDKERGWMKPKLGNCTSNAYHDLKKDLKNMADNPEQLCEHSVRMTMDAVTRLYEASTATEKLYQGDVLMSYKLAMKILSTQHSLSGFDLTASRRKDFNDYLIDSMSQTLSKDNLGYWKALQLPPNSDKPSANHVNSAELMQSFEEYIATLAQNMNSMWYPSIKVTSANIQLLIKDMSNTEEERIDLGSDSDAGEKSSVSVKMLLPDDGDRKGLPENGTIGVLTFSTLGDVLPMWFHDSRLDMRRPQKGFVNSAVVSVVAHNRLNRTTRLSRDLITITFLLLKDGGSNPQCVFWNFTARSDTPYGGWSQKGCSAKKSNKTHITCACSHLTSFAIVSDEEVVSVLEGLPVKITLYASVVVISVCITICLGLSLFLEDVKSNHASIHNNFGASVLLSEICFAVGIMQTDDTYACMAFAIFIHFFFMSTLAWVFVEGLHLYRMLKEKRNVDRGNMRVYFLIGWGLPAIITALSVGLDAKGFGNANFCWIRTDHMLVWSFAGPLLFCAIVYIILFCMTLGKYFTSKLPDKKLASVRSNLRASFILLPIVSALWGLALFAINENKAELYYLFALVNVILGILLLLLHCVFNKEVRSAIRAVKQRRWQRTELNTTKQHLLKNSILRTPDTSNGAARLDIDTSASSTNTASTRRDNLLNSSLFHDRAVSDLDLSDDSDSELSNSSLSLASTHSSDDDDDEGRPSYLNVNNCNNWHLKNGHLPIRKLQNNALVVHSTPKADESFGDNQHRPPQGLATSTPKCDLYKSSLPTVSESNHEHEHETPSEEPHYLSVNSNSRKDKSGKSKQENIEMIPLQNMDSLPKKGILKNGRRSKPPIPSRSDSLQRNSPMTSEPVTDETSLLKRDELDKVKVIRDSPLPGQQDEQL